MRAQLSAIRLANLCRTYVLGNNLNRDADCFSGRVPVAGQPDYLCTLEHHQSPPTYLTPTAFYYPNQYLFQSCISIAFEASILWYRLALDGTF